MKQNYADIDQMSQASSQVSIPTNKLSVRNLRKLKDNNDVSNYHESVSDLRKRPATAIS